jgi:hypothetical protein
MDPSSRTSLLGEAALIIFAGAVDTGDGRTIEQFVDAMAKNSTLENGSQRDSGAKGNA